MNSPHSPWSRLAAGARAAQAAEQPGFAPIGFSTRVVALAFPGGGEPSFTMLFARFSWRALGVCALIMAVGVAINLTPALNAIERDAVVYSDPVAEWLAAS